MSELREKIARIIDPEPWKWRDRNAYLDTIQADIEDSLAKADEKPSAKSTRGSTA